MALNRFFPLLIGGALALALPTPTARAQHPHPPSPRPPFMPPLPRQQLLPVDLSLVAQKANVQINGATARVRLVQTLQNPQPRAVEGTYLWSVPPGAAISDLNVTLGGKKLQAEILDADKAREIYTGIVRQMRDPAILEFVGRDLVRARIFPVPANGQVEVELAYSQPLQNNRFTLPLRAPGGAINVAASLDLSFENRDVKAVYSPSHPIETMRRSDQTRVTGEWKSADRDFVLGWTRGQGAVALDLLTFQRPGEDDGTFLLLAAPDARAADAQIEAKDVTFVFDTSGSMNDDGKIEQARRALLTLLANLRAGDRFNIVTFASDVRPFRDGLVPASEQNLSAARGFIGAIKAVGGTNIEAALQKALQNTGTGRDEKARPRQLVFLTDGLPTVGQTNVDALLDEARSENKNGARMWTFGVGFDVNTRLLDGLASEHGGDADYVTPREDIETKVGALYAKIAYPVTTDLRLDFGGMETYDVYPRRLPDLFRGGQMLVMGRFKGAPAAKNLAVKLTGQLNGQTRSFSGQTSAGGDELPRLWATRKIGFLIEDARRAGRPLDGEVRAEILQLSTRYGVVTPLTAALITEDSPPTLMRGGVAGPLPRNLGGAGVLAAPMESALAGRADYNAQTGAGAVAASKAVGQLQKGYAAPVASSGTKVLGGKTFVLKRGVWTDSAYDAAKFPHPTIVKFGSDAYFKWLDDAPVAQWLSAGDAVIFVKDGVAVQVEP